MGSSAAATCSKPQFWLPAAQVIQLAQSQTVRQTAYKRTTLFNNSANGTTIVPKRQRLNRFKPSKSGFAEVISFLTRASDQTDLSQWNLCNLSIF
jgi:hypothetical protein